MKRSTLMGLVGIATLGITTASNAAEFQTPGMLGTGRAGIARTTDAYATFVNPAGLAFNEKPFSAKFNAGVGVSISSALADNIDKIGKLDLSNQGLSYDNTANAATALQATGKAVQFVAIAEDLAKRKGDLAVNVDAALGFQYRNFGLGLIGGTEFGAGFSKIDTTNLRAGNSTSTSTVSATNIASLASDIRTAPTTSATSVFSATQRNDIITALTANGGTAADAATIADKLGQLLASNNTTGMTTDQLTQAVQTLAKSFNGGTIKNNDTSVELRGLLLMEVPIGYGHKFDLGSFGQVGVGAAIKVMQGTVYSQEVRVNDTTLKGSSDLTKKVKDSKTDSTNVGIDLGAMWRYEEFKNTVGPINVAFVLKNLNSPDFDAPKATTGSTSTPVPGFTKVKVEPQARLGVALQPLSWLDIVADADLTENKTVMPGRKVQNIGAGLELSPVSFFALRGGIFSNMSTSDGPVLTTGLSFGPHWLRLDIDAAVSTESGRYKNASYPREAKVEFGLSTMF